MSSYDKFKKEFYAIYPEFYTNDYVFKLIGDKLLVLKSTNNKIKNNYIANKEHAKYFGDNLIIKLICKISNLKETFVTIESDNIKYTVLTLVKSNYYKSLENIYYKYINKQKNYTGKFTSRHKNGNLCSIGDFFNGKKNGFWTFYYDNGQKRLSGNYIDGVKDGLFTEWNKIGIKTREMTYRDNLHEGEYKVWYHNGNIKKHGNYIHDAKKGLWKYYYITGDIEKLEEFT